MPRCAVAAELAPFRPSGRPPLERARIWLAAPKAALASWRFPAASRAAEPGDSPWGWPPGVAAPGTVGQLPAFPGVRFGRRGSARVAAPQSRLVHLRGVLPTPEVPPQRGGSLWWCPGPTRLHRAAATGFGVRIDLPARFAGLVSPWALWGAPAARTLICVRAGAWERSRSPGTCSFSSPGP